MRKTVKIKAIICSLLLSFVFSVALVPATLTTASAATANYTVEAVTIENPNGSSGYFPGLKLEGESNVEYTIANIDLTNEDFLNAKKPIAQILPYTAAEMEILQGMKSNQSQENFAKNATFTTAYLDFVSTVNPQKRISILFYTRTNDVYELNIAARMDNKGRYCAESWYNDKKNADGTFKKTKRQLLGPWSKGTALVTQKFDLAGHAYRDVFRDEEDNPISSIHPLSFYYDRNTQELTMDTGVCAEYSPGDAIPDVRGEQTRVKRSNKWRYMIRDLDYAYDGDGETWPAPKKADGTVDESVDPNGLGWTPFTDEEASSVNVVFRFGELVENTTGKKPTVTFITLGGNLMAGDKEEGVTWGEYYSSQATERVYSHNVSYVSAGSVVNIEEVYADDFPAGFIAPTREGFTFAGWYNGETRYVFAEKLTADLTLTAKWQFDCPSCTAKVDEGADKCPSCEHSFVETPETEPGDTEEKKDGCGKETIALVATVLSGLAVALAIKRIK